MQQIPMHNNPQSDTAPLVKIRGLKTQFFTEDGIVKAVDDVDLDIHSNRTLCILGESGSGKSIMARSILRIVDNPGRIVEGSIHYRSADGREVDLAKERHGSRLLRDVRGQDISMIFQEPMSSLGPITKIGQQIVETIRLHRNVTKAEAKAEAIHLLDRVGIPRPAERFEAYPFELSGGMRQRAMIAMALSCQPRLLIADEPTTALDVTTQAQILDLIAELKQERQMGVMLITHDMGVVAEVAEDVAVMYSGKIVERGDVYSVFENPKHPYTKALLASAPRLGGIRRRRLPDIRELLPPGYMNNPANLSPDARLEGHKVAEIAPAEPKTHNEEDRILEVKNLNVHFPIGGGVFSKSTDVVKACDEISFDVYRGETFGIVGESGSGKTSLSRAIMRILDPTSGEVLFHRKAKPTVDLTQANKSELRDVWRDMRMVFQDPQSSLNPRLRVIDLVGQCLQKAESLGRRDLQARVSDLLVQAGLKTEFLLRYPGAFSGGQRQRLGIARALATNPELVIADEAVSALDVSIQAQMLNLLQDLQDEFDLTYLFITHDLSVVKHICDRVAVMYQGKIVELTTRDELFANPKHPYTKKLLAAVPNPDPRMRKAS
ncbi:ABC transporter ATP-binding protein [Cognatishimia sp. SS12]|uniref:ABC transporter ATP-binding protein n=1 Tax=Cognatishimia sp. SS12 TaxID=2979465 RepID=UPI00232BB384|nr:ABC transporter ATP-binding protein [Cognatishimia sp. SS12]MDC0739598.1 ABC transporter ATP-binding protein [Cognatishimia sp. SS12]